MKYLLAASLCALTFVRAAVGQTSPIAIEGRIEEVEPNDLFLGTPNLA